MRFILIIISVCANFYVAAQSDSISIKQYAGTGKISSITPFLGGLIHGIHVEFSLKGDTLKKSFYTFGRIDSMYDFYPSGEIESILIFKKGILDSCALYQSERGEQLHIGSFKDGNGNIIEYYGNNRIRRITSFQNGLEHGEILEFRRNGRIECIFQVVRGEIVSKMNFRRSGTCWGKIYYKRNSSLAERTEYFNKRGVRTHIVYWEYDPILSNRTVYFDSKGNPIEKTK